MKGSYSEDERMFDLALKRAFAELEDLPPAHAHTEAEARADVEVMLACDDADAGYIEEFLTWAGEQEFSGLDFETNRVRPYRKDSVIATASVSAAGRTIAFPIDHPEARWSTANRQRVWDALGMFIRDHKGRCAVQNLAFELEWIGVLFGREYIRSALWDDTMSQAFVLDQRMGPDPGGEDDDGIMTCFGLGFLTLLHFGIDIKPLSNVDTSNILGTPLRQVLPYNGIDAKYHLLLRNAQDALLRRDGLLSVYEDNHLPRIATSVLTQIKGVPIDNDVAEKLQSEYQAQIKELTKKIEALPIVKEFFRQKGERFKPTSNSHMTIMCRDILKSDAGAKVTNFGGIKKVSYSVNETTLKKIGHEVTKLTLELRSVSKLESTYVWPASSPLVYPDGLLHPQLNTVRTRTSRLSSSDPNEQNIPKRDGEQKKVRKQIAAKKKQLLLSLDQGQIEARVFAMASKDKVFTQSLWENIDVHADEARHLAMAYPSRIGGKSFLNDKEVMDKFRDSVKGGWVFALFFGAQLSTAAAQVEIPEEYLRKEYDRFWSTFSGVYDWQQRNAAFYREHGYVEMLTGRRRCGPLSANKTINTPIQGTAGEIVMDSMNRISVFAENDWDKHPYMMIHDDLGFIAPENRVDDIAEMAITEMTRPAFDFINVPLVVELSIGENLYDMKKAGKFSSVDWHGKAAHYV